MQKIHIINTVPNVFLNRDDVTSDVWHKKVELCKGNTYLIEANSGTGKSSLLSYIYGYRQDYHGDILFDDVNIKSLSVRQWTDVRNFSVALMWQDLRLFPELTAYENVKIKNNLTHYQKKSQVKKWFDILGISDKWDSLVAKLSFGQQQRVAVIRSLCQPFDFFFLDEPISHLDETNSNLMARIVVDEAKKQGAGIIVTSIGKRLDLDYDYILKL